MDYVEKDITFPTGKPFVFFIYLGDELRYIGCTENLNKRGFIFPFEFDRITGYYYDLAVDVHDYVDSLIIERKPTMCAPRYGMMEKNLRKYLKEQFGRFFPISEYRRIKQDYLTDDDFYTYNGIRYIKELSRETLVLSLAKDLNIKSKLEQSWNIR